MPIKDIKKPITSLKKYIEIIDEIQSEATNSNDFYSILFRGQEQDLDLIPIIARPEINIKDQLTKIEQNIFYEFKRACAPFINSQQLTDWDFLSLARHHGLPTRLLDWTSNALIGLWFAVYKSPVNNGNGVVWVFKPQETDYINYYEEIGPLNNEKNTRIFKPKPIDKRMIAQASLFTVHKLYDKKGNKRAINFEKHKTYSNKLIKLRILANDFGPLKNSLNLLGINNSTVFPDLDGLCSHLSWNFFNKYNK